MTIISLSEVIDLIIMTAAIGFIFSRFFKEPSADYDPLKAYTKKRFFDWDNFKFAAMVTAPAIILHEMAHKFVALSFGAQAVFHAAYTWLGLGVLLRLMNFGFIFFIPGYVSYFSASLTHLQIALIAVAGPLTNLLIFFAATYMLKRVMSKKWRATLYLTKQINLFLFIFNMLPIKPFDGGHFFSSILQAF